MLVQIDDHAKKRALERGASEDEVYDTLKTGKTITAKSDRLAKEKIYTFNEKWNGKFYEQKQVKVIYIVEGTTTIVITVVVKYGNFTVV